MRNFITADFMDRIASTGELAKAAERRRNPIPVRDFFRGLSTWALICEEVLDTQHDPSIYDECLAELVQREVSPKHLLQMRLFAWKTAGWLNYEKALWEEYRLDESEIFLPLEWMEREGKIDPFQRLQSIGYVRDWRGCEPPVLPPYP